MRRSPAMVMRLSGYAENGSCSAMFAISRYSVNVFDRLG